MNTGTRSRGKRPVAMAAGERRAEETPQAGDQVFKALADHAPDLIARFDREFRHLYVNPLVEKISGVPAAAFIGKTNQELGMPPDLDAVWVQAFREVFQTGRTKDLDFDFEGVDGIHHFHSRIAPEFGPDGTVQSLVSIVRDMTARKRADDAARAGDRAFRVLADNAPDLIARLDLEFRHLYVNPMVEKVSGVPAAAFIGKTNKELGIPAELDAQGLAACREVVATGRTKEIEFELPTPQGVRSYQSRIAPEYGPDGKVAHLVVFSRDITRHKQMEEALAKANDALEQRVRERTAELAQAVARLEEEIPRRQKIEQNLRESEDKYRALVEKTSDVMYATDAEGNITYISPQVERFGLRPEQLLNRSFLEFVSPIDRDAAALDFRKTMETGREIPTCFRFTDGYGREIWLEDQGKIRRDADGRIIGLIGMVREITDRKHVELALRASEEQNRALLNALPDLMFLLDREGRFTAFHSASIESLYVPPEQFIGKRATEVLPPAVADLIMTHLNALSVAGTVSRFEYELPMPSGPRWYEASATLCGENTAMLLVRDVTERRQAEFRLWEANAALEQRTIQLRALASELTLAEQRERRRLAELLHDHLQQLLVGATLRLPFLERAKEAPVRRAAAELHDLLKQSLECSRSLTGELSPPILHQGGLVPALKWLANWMQEKHGLSVALRAGRGVVLEAQDLTILLFQSIRELLFNAAKYAQVKTVDVELERSGAFIKAVVADQGIGFDPASLRATGGTASGFGLYAIRERLDLMGGRLEIASAPGQGSRFTLWVPVHDAPDREPSAAVAAPATAEPPAAPGLPPAAGTVQRKIRVLLVDDHSVVRQALAHLLGEEPDLDIVGEAADGPAAIAQVRRLLPDVVTMDVSMPGMNGIEATRIIHAEFPALRIIGLSLFTETERAEEMRRAGAAEYLTKSGPADALLAAIRGVHGPNHSR